MKLHIASLLSFLFFSLVTAQLPNEERGQREDRRGPNTPKPIIISGEVVFDDGSRPEEPVQVEMVCNGAVHRQTHTVFGHFSLEFGTNNAVRFVDASVDRTGRGDEYFLGRHNELGDPGFEAYSDTVRNTLDLSGCELRAALPGFQSEGIPLGRRRALDNPNVGTLVLHRLVEVKGTTVSVKTLKAPKKAKKAYRRAQAELRKKKSDPLKAARELEKATKEYPDFAAAWHLLGSIRVAQQDQNRAHQAFASAIAADPEYIPPYVALARLQFGQGRWEEVDKLSREVITLNPYMTYAHYLCAAANYSMAKLDLAEEAARKVLDSQEGQRYPQTHFILGGILAQKGNIPSAAAEFNQFLELEPKGALARQTQQILTDWERQGLIRRREAAAVPEN